LSGVDDGLSAISALVAMVADWHNDLRGFARTGGPLGAAACLDEIERKTGRSLTGRRERADQSAGAQG